MRIGVVSDIHGNNIALKACLKQLELLGCDEYFLLGDFISDLYGTRETLDLIYDFKRNHICHILRGNREEYMIGQRKDIRANNTEKLWIKNSASGNLLFCYEQLNDEDLDYFETLPISFTFHKEGYPDIRCCHGSPSSCRELLQLDGDNTKEWLEKIDEDYMICGHTHYPGEFEYKNKHYYNNGSVGISIKDKGLAQCMMLEGVNEAGKNCWKPTFYKIPYDYKKAARDIMEHGMLDYGKWFVNSNLYTILTGRDLSYAMLMKAFEIADSSGLQNEWPLVDEECFEKAAMIVGVPDYRKIESDSL